MARIVFCLAVLSALLLVSVFAAYDDKRAPKGFVLANNYFGFKLLNQLSAENDKKPTRDNIFFSPYSVTVAMAMLHQGAGGSTAKELESVLGYQLAKMDKSDKHDLAKQIEESNKDIFLPETSSPDNNANYTLKTGNALISNKQFPLLDAYKQTLTNNFKAESFNLDFGKDPVAAMNFINEWCANKTNQKIKSLLSEPPSPATQLALINAVYFKGNWKHKFDKNKTLPDTFTGPNGVKYENVPFMNIKGHYKMVHLEELDAGLVELPYEGNDLSMYGIVPFEKDDDLKQLKAALTPWYLESAIGRAFSANIKLKFPKLDFKTNYDMVDTLGAMGMGEVFNGQKADLSGLSNVKPLAVDKVKHVATIEVNEAGTEAAAATFVGITKIALVTPTQPLLLSFDHPFLFVIRHNKNGQILFVGEVNRF